MKNIILSAFLSVLGVFTIGLAVIGAVTLAFLITEIRKQLKNKH